MLNYFKENVNKSSIDNLLKNKDDYTLLSKVAYKKHQPSIGKAIEHSHNEYDPSLSSHTEKVLYHPFSKETVMSNAGTNVRSKIFSMTLQQIMQYFLDSKNRIKYLINHKIIEVNMVMI